MPPELELPGSLAGQTLRTAGLPYDAIVRKPDCDVIVVGGGPGGSSAATKLAQEGKSVLLLDQKAFPRDKACGDAVPYRGLNFMQKELGIDIPRSGLIYEPLSAFAIGTNSKEIVVRGKKPVAFTSKRENLDDVLLQKALQKGVLFEQVHVERPLYDNGTVVGVAGAGKKEFTARVVIAAGGATCPITTDLRGRVASQEERAIAIRTYAKLPDRLDDRLVLRFLKHLMPGGYAWIFRLPNGEVNLGLGLFDFHKYRGVNIKQLNNEFIQALQVEFPGLEVDEKSIKVWQIPFYVVFDDDTDMSRVVNGVPLVGDAGRNTDALTGGGILPAMQTGRLAALYALQILGGVGEEEAKAHFDRAYKDLIGEKLANAYRVQLDIVHSQLLRNPAISSRIPERFYPRFETFREKVERDYLIFTWLFNLAYYFPPARYAILRALTGEHTDEKVNF